MEKINKKNKRFLLNINRFRYHWIIYIIFLEWEIEINKNIIIKIISIWIRNRR